ncbi:HEAT repeat domain-containing protein [Myxococcota bacterium]
MRSMKPGPVLLVLFSAWMTGCVITANAGRYIPDDRPDTRSDPVELKVGVVEFTDRRGAHTDDTRRLTESFLADLKSWGIYARVVGSADNVDVILAGRALSMQQPISERHMDNQAMGMLIPMVMSSLGVLPLLGVPTDCGNAKATIDVRALDPRFGQELYNWYGEGSGRSCSGLYYRGWPLSKALSRATGKILTGMERDAPKLKKDLLVMKNWHQKYGLSVPALIRALGDSDKRIRVRAVAALGELGPKAIAAAPALVGCLADEDRPVRREAIRALLALKAVDDKTLSLLAELRKKSKNRYDIDRATRALKFLRLSKGLPPGLAEQVAMLGSLDPQERIAAAKAIGRSRDALPALILALEDPNPDVRLQVVSALESIGAYDHPASYTALSKASRNDRDRRIRQAAQETLRRLELLALSEGRPINKSRPQPSKTVAATDGPVVAVFVTQEALRHLKRGQLSDYLAVRLTSECGYRIVPQDQIKKQLVEEKKKTYRHCYDQRCRIELGKAIAAEKILAVRIFKTGSQCVVTANLYDLRTEATERAATTRVKCSDAALMTALDTITRQLSSAPRISGQ